MSGGDAWAVGSYRVGSGLGETRTLVLHWNGSSWSRQASPSLGPTGHQSTYLSGVVALSATTAWAVGSYWSGTHDRTLVLRWNGRAWRQVASPNGASGGVTRDSYLQGVDAVPGSAWVVGYFFDDSTHEDRTLTLHWDGSKWARVASPNGVANGFTPTNMLLGVAIASSHDVWAAGTVFHSNDPAAQTLILHWNGSAWKREATPDPANDGATLNENDLFGIAAVSDTRAWAVGDFGDYTNGTRTLTLHCC